MVQLTTPTGAQFIDGILWGWQWSSTSWGFSFPTTTAPYVQFNYEAINGFVPFNAQQQSEIRNIISDIETFAAVTFFNPNPNIVFQFAQASQIDYGFGPNDQLHGPGSSTLQGVSAEAAIPDPNQQNINAAGDTWYTTNFYTTPQPGSFQFAAGLLHEFGHALGLKHGHLPQDVKDGFGNVIRTAPALPAEFDSQNYSVMTYRTFTGDDFTTNADNFPGRNAEYPSTYMMLDVIALQHMYGANFGAGSNPGNTIYSFDQNTGSRIITENGVSSTSSPTESGRIFYTIWDGGGYDTYDFRNFSVDATVDLNPGTFSTISPSHLAQLGPNVNAFGNVANALQYQGDPRSLIEAAFTGVANDHLYGNTQNNYLNAGAGSDYLDGRTGADQMIGGSGNDTYIVDNAGDVVTEFTGEGDDIVDTSVTYTVPVNVEVLRMLGNGNIDATGTASRDIIQGNAGNNIINGAGGFDVMQGGAGNDTYAVDNASDAVIETAGGGFDNVYSSVDYIIDGAQEIESAILTGNAVVLRGSASNNQLFGNAQVNVIDGREGTDYMLGLGGADIFQINLEAGAVDVVGDFSKAEGDRMAFTGFNQSTTFVNQASLTSFEVRDTKGTQTLADDTVQTFQLNDSYGSGTYTQGALVFGVDYYFG